MSYLLVGADRGGRFGVQTPPPPPPGWSLLNEPTFGDDATDSVLVQDGFDTYASVSDLNAAAVTPGVHLGCDGFNAANFSLTTGRTGVGKALRVPYVGDAAHQEINKLLTFRDGHAYSEDAVNPLDDLTTNRMVVVQDWRRYTTDNPLGDFDGFAMKNMEFYYPGADANIRQLFLTGDHLPYNTGWSKGAIFKCLGLDETNSDGAQARQEPCFTTLVQNAVWFKTTYYCRFNTSAAQKDGFSGVWITCPALGIAPTEIVRVRQNSVGVVPAGGDVTGFPFSQNVSTGVFDVPTGDGANMPWCHQADVDKMGLSQDRAHYVNAISSLVWFHQLIGYSPAGGFKIDIDDVFCFTRSAMPSTL